MYVCMYVCMYVKDCLLCMRAVMIDDGVGRRCVVLLGRSISGEDRGWGAFRTYIRTCIGPVPR